MVYFWDGCPCVLARSGCSDNVAETRWLVNNRNFSLTVLDAGKYKFSECPFLGPSLIVASHGGEAKGAFWVLFYKRIFF